MLKTLAHVTAAVRSGLSCGFRWSGVWLQGTTVFAISCLADTAHPPFFLLWARTNFSHGSLCGAQAIGFSDFEKFQVKGVKGNVNGLQQGARLRLAPLVKNAKVSKGPQQETNEFHSKSQHVRHVHKFLTNRNRNKTMRSKGTE